MGSGFRRAFDAVLVVVWAARCAACGRLLEVPTGGPVCGACWRSTVIMRGSCCDRCGVPLFPLENAPRLDGPPLSASTEREAAEAPRDDQPVTYLCGACVGAKEGPILRARAAGLYLGSLRDIVHAYKYHGHRSLAAPLAARMYTAGQDVLAGAEVVVPVPLHVRKQWQRGFNQAADLAVLLPARRLPALRRRRPTLAQAGLSGPARRQNVGGAFAPAWRLVASDWCADSRVAARMLPASARGWLAGRWSVRNRTVLLVDDVRTTGATLEECARVLQTCGAREVRALTVALVEKAGNRE